MVRVTNLLRYNSGYRLHSVLVGVGSWREGGGKLGMAIAHDREKFTVTK